MHKHRIGFVGNTQVKRPSFCNKPLVLAGANKHFFITIHKH